MLFEMHLTQEIISVLKFRDVHYPKRDFKVVYWICNFILVMLQNNFHST